MAKRLLFMTPGMLKAVRRVEKKAGEFTSLAKPLLSNGCHPVIDKAREMGVKKLILFSNSLLKNAIHFYRKLGFEDIPVTPEVMVVLILWWKLNSSNSIIKAIY